ncbi:MAG TPA: PP2C family protein-serine/threonine phosphatase [Thermoanaerobaculia bacterium]|nr:PP2C family protein-serine/threonine phosphatase [Thermoanaerobaculia bacterium]
MNPSLPAKTQRAVVAQQPTVSVHLGRRPDLITVFLIAMFLGGLIGMMIGLSGEKPPKNPQKAFLAVTALMGALASLPVLYYLRRRPTFFDVTRDEVRLRERKKTSAIPMGQISRLNYFKQSFLRSFYTVEGRDGVSLTFAMIGNQRLSGLQEVLDALEERTGLQWVGRRATTRFRDFVAALRAATNSRNGWRLLGWVGRKALYIRGDDAGVNDPLLRWGYFLVTLAGGVALFSVEMIIIGKLRSIAWCAVLIAVVYFLSTLGVNVILVLMRQQVRGREALESELLAAREVQTRLLPRSTPVIRGLDFAAACIPAREVGGDYYDFISLPGEACVAVVADVSGKGLAAGLLMTLTKGALTSRLAQGEALDLALTSVNSTIRSSAEKNLFVSMVVASVDHAGEVLLLRAGHNPPFMLRKDGSSERLTPSGIALGFADAALFARQSVVQRLSMKPGDSLILYSDGVTEAMNGAGEEYGEERLLAMANRGSYASAAEIKDALLEDVGAFREGAPVNDDLTLVIIRAV